MTNKVEPLVTVIIPTVESRAYLKTAIRSVLSQSHKNMEIIVSDNGAATEVRPFLEKLDIYDERIVFRRNDKRITMIDHLNQCLGLASGKYFVTVSDDDYISENFIELLVGKFENNEGVTIGLSSCIMIDSDSKVISKVSGESTALWDVKSGVDFIKEYLFKKNSLPVATFISLFTKTALFRSVGGFPNFEKGGHSDTAAAINLCLKGNIVFASEAIFYYRIYSTSSGLSMTYKSLAKCGQQFIRYYKESVSQNVNINGFDKANLVKTVRRISFECYLDRLTPVYKMKRLSKLRALFDYDLTLYELKYLLSKVATQLKKKFVTT